MQTYVFNQNNIVHQFYGTPVGGEIIITALNGSDRQTINQIKNHITEIQKEFSEGNFTKPFFIHAQEVLGTGVMSEKKELIKNYVDFCSSSFIFMKSSNSECLNSESNFSLPLVSIFLLSWRSMTLIIPIGGISSSIKAFTASITL